MEKFVAKCLKDAASNFTQPIKKSTVYEVLYFHKKQLTAIGEICDFGLLREGINKGHFWSYITERFRMLILSQVIYEIFETAD